MNGGSLEIRTLDPLIKRQLLCQLSQGSWLDLPELNWRPQTYQVCALTYWAKVQWMVAGDRLELSTSEVWAQRSDQLNYPATWRTQSELNRRHLVFQTSTLTTTELHVRDWSFRSDSNRRLSSWLNGVADRPLKPLGYWSLAGAKRIELISVVLETIILPLN